VRIVGRGRRGPERQRPDLSKAAADADEAIAPQDRDAFGRLRRGRRNPPAGGPRKRNFGGRGKPPRQDLKGFGPEGDAEAGGSGGNRPEADAGQGPGRIFGSGLGPDLRQVADGLARSLFGGGAEGRSLLRPRARGGREVRLALEPRRGKGVRLRPEPGETGGFALPWSRQAGRRVSAQIPADGKRRSVRAPCATHGSRTRFRLAPEPTHPAGDRPASAARSGAWDFGGWRRRRPPCSLGRGGCHQGIAKVRKPLPGWDWRLGVRGQALVLGPNPKPQSPIPSPPLDSHP
jgi:hypothetical protein